MATHYLAHDLSVVGMLHTHATWSLQDVKAYDPRELGSDQFLFPVHREHRNLERITVSAVRNIAAKHY